MLLPDSIIYDQNVGHTTINVRISWIEDCIASIYELNDQFSENNFSSRHIVTCSWRKIQLLKQLLSMQQYIGDF